MDLEMDYQVALLKALLRGMKLGLAQEILCTSKAQIHKWKSGATKMPKANRMIAAMYLKKRHGFQAETALKNFDELKNIEISVPGKQSNDDLVEIERILKKIVLQRIRKSIQVTPTTQEIEVCAEIAQPEKPRSPFKK